MECASFHTNCNSGLPERRIYLCGSEGAIRADLIKGEIEHRRIGFRETSHLIDMNKHSGGHGGGDEVMAGELAQCMLNGVPTTTPLDTGLIAAITCIAADDARARRPCSISNQFGREFSVNQPSPVTN